MDRYVTPVIVVWVLRSALAAIFVLDHITLARRLAGVSWPARLVYPAVPGWQAGHRRFAAGWWICLVGWALLGLIPVRWLTFVS